MTNIYRLNKLNSDELEKVVGGGFTDFVLKTACFLGLCNADPCITIEAKATADRMTKYYKNACPRCGRCYYIREDITSYGPEGANGYITKISRTEYNNANAPINLLAL